MSRYAVIGGGPAGLYFAALAKSLDPTREITVWERNAADDTFGFGVVFSDETLDGIAAADPVIAAAMEAEFARWSDIDIHYRGRVETSGGHGFAAISRMRLLQIMQQRCLDLGVDVRFQSVAPTAAELSAEYDLVVAADGVNSLTRTAFADVFQPSLDPRTCRYMWLGTDRVFEAFTFIIAETPYGPMQVHAYPFSRERSTFIVEMTERTWAAACLADEPRTDESSTDECGPARMTELLADHLGGHKLITNNSKWLRFTTVRNKTWRHNNIVLLGDAAHTAHFSIGSGTKLAMEDALALAANIQRHNDIATALERYEADRRPVVQSTQRAAQASLEWFETIEHAVDKAPEQFAFNLLTRSRRVTYDNLRQRDPAYVSRLDTWFGDGNPPLFQPYALGDARLRNRIVSAPITLDVAVDGVPGDVEFAHLAGKALGGSGLVLSGRTAVSPEGRKSPGCTGLYSSGQVKAWRRITDFVHEHTGSLIGVQLSHASRDLTLPVEEIAADFARAARNAVAAGFDVIELQAGHGNLLSVHLSPLTSPHINREFPLQVLDSVLDGVRGELPVIVRISAVDWAPGGTTIEESVATAAAFVAAGAAAIDVSSGEVVPHEKPLYGRSYQTPFAERIRADVGAPTIAVGGISSADDANSIVLAGRADLVAIGHAQLHDPSWPLHAAAALDYAGEGAFWPAMHRAGSGRPPSAGRARPQLSLWDKEDSLHRRWRTNG
ncbi:oxidoreductase [Kutzneria sp. CA-103260]|uniref:oxidoreductase n=1 Tax=Kutzneria sp. CA-103260 TaxID=2802641 RepID=UPI001BAADE83|nr:FAD-dependent monooxygenase [Kutzneria sp. CA-103260]QUQ62520.1 salicylyl-CoA 5-hydroxylase [Kutzneria sp. CA-103260]